MNRFFDFSRRQLLFLAALTLVSTVAVVYLLLQAWLPSASGTGLPEVYEAASRDSGQPSIATFQLVIDPNTAPIDSLELLPGIGPVKAEKIIEYRRSQPFTSPEDLLEIDGIGSHTLQQIEPHLRISLHE
jgi:competence protein ComEA